MASASRNAHAAEINDLLPQVHPDKQEEVFNDIIQYLRNFLSPSQVSSSGNITRTPLTSDVHVLENCDKCGGHGKVKGRPHSLSEVLKRRDRPNALTRTDPGVAPKGTGWICVLCSDEVLPSRRRSSDLRSHLVKIHNFKKDEVRKVFNPKDIDKLYEHFGPFSVSQAEENGLRHRMFTEPGARKRLTASSPVEQALPEKFPPKRTTERSKNPQKQPEDLTHAEFSAACSIDPPLTGTTIQARDEAESELSDLGGTSVYHSKEHHMSLESSDEPGFAISAEPYPFGSDEWRLSMGEQFAGVTQKPYPLDGDTDYGS